MMTAEETEWREQSVWSSVCALAPASEHVELRRLVGPSLVDSVQDLCQECVTLLGIWRSYRQETTDLERSSTSRRLPEPPALRDRLKQEILLFVSSLEQFQGLHALDTLPAKERHAIEYSKKAGSDRPQTATARPQTARSRDGQEVPVRVGSANSERSLSSRESNSPLAERLEMQGDRINVFDAQHILQHIKEVAPFVMQLLVNACGTLQEEQEQLLSDINFLQQAIEGEHDYRRALEGQGTEVPSIQSLRECRTALEHRLLRGSQQVNKEPLPESQQFRNSGSSSLGHQHMPRRQLPTPLKRSITPITANDRAQTATPTTQTDRKTRQLPLPPSATTTQPLRPLTSSTQTSLLSQQPLDHRPSTAQKFRQMVEACREHEE